MTQIIEIEGGRVRQIERRVMREVRLEDLLPHMVEARPVTIPVLPETAKFIHWDETDPNSKVLYVLCQIRPGMKNLIKRVNYDGTRRRYRLAMPWTYFWFVCRTTGDINEFRWSLDDYKVFHARSPFTSIDTPMIPAMLPNVYDDGRICFGSTGTNPNQPLADRLDEIVRTWYLSAFNDDLHIRYPNEGTNYRAWVEESRTNLNCWQGWAEWTNDNVPKITVRDLMAGFVPNFTEQQIIVSGEIPQIEAPFTFGRAEEWLRERVPAPYRARLRRALENIVADDASYIPTENMEPDTVVEVNSGDDGGEVVNA